MKLFAIIAVSSVLSHGTPAMHTFSIKAALTSMLNQTHGQRALPALDYFFFAA